MLTCIRSLMPAVTLLLLQFRVVAFYEELFNGSNCQNAKFEEAEKFKNKLLYIPTMLGGGLVANAYKFEFNNGSRLTPQSKDSGFAVKSFVACKAVDKDKHIIQMDKLKSFINETNALFWMNTERASEQEHYGPFVRADPANLCFYYRYKASEYKQLMGIENLKVSFYDDIEIDVNDDEIFVAMIVMELFEGTLDDKIHKSTSDLNKFDIDIPTKIQWTNALPIQVKNLHDIRFSHLDIKPDNIFFRDDMTPILGDFGLAKVINDEQGFEMDSSDSEMNSYYKYEAPEVTDNVPVRSSFADVYSLAVVIFQLWNGNIPSEFLDKSSIHSAKQSHRKLILEFCSNEKIIIYNNIESNYILNRFIYCSAYDNIIKSMLKDLKFEEKAKTIIPENTLGGKRLGFALLASLNEMKRKIDLSNPERPNIHVVVQKMSEATHKAIQMYNQILPIINKVILAFYNTEAIEEQLYDLNSEMMIDTIQNNKNYLNNLQKLDEYFTNVLTYVKEILPTHQTAFIQDNKAIISYVEDFTNLNPYDELKSDGELKDNLIQQVEGEKILKLENSKAVEMYLGDEHTRIDNWFTTSKIYRLKENSDLTQSYRLVI